MKLLRSLPRLVAYAPIDLKKAVIRFRDGFASSGACTLAVSAAEDATSLSLTGCLTAIPVGVTVKLGAFTTLYYVASSSGASGASGVQSITITPKLEDDLAASTGVVFGPRCLEVKIGTGNLTYSEPKARQYVLDRGLLDTVRDADEAPVDVTLDFVWDWLSGIGSSGIPTIEEVLKNIGEADDWITSSADTCEPYCVDLEIWYDPGCGTTQYMKELIQLKMFRYEKLDHNLRDAQCAISGKCNVTAATVTRVI